LRQILDEGLEDGPGKRHFIPVVEPVEFQQPEQQANVSLTGLRQKTALTQRQ